MRLICCFVLFAANFFLLGCGDDGEIGVPVLTTSPPSAPPQTQPVALRSGVADALRAGKYIQIHLNRATFDDSGWVANGDPLGPIQAGKKYILSFESSTAKFTAVGWQEMVGRNWVSTGTNGDLNLWKISLWGHVFELVEQDALVLVKDSALGIVGEVQILSSPAIIQAQERVSSGLPILMSFNQHNAAIDTGWSGSSATDPLGTFLVGEQYSLRYDSGTDGFEVSGLHESDNMLRASFTPRIVRNSAGTVLWTAVISQGEVNGWGWRFQMVQGPDNQVLLKCTSGAGASVCENLNIVGKID